jgi:nucleoside 2-deoxyribosyltransferase
MIIFLAAPFTNYKQPNIFDKKLKKELIFLIQKLKQHNIDIISAHEREEWGKLLDKPEVSLRLDFEGIDKSDILIALLGDPPSPGVQLELGYAIAKKKKIICLYKKGDTLPYLVPGISSLTNFVLIKYNNSIKQVMGKLFEEIK